MTRTSKYTAWGLLATLAATVAGPVLADQQSDKNTLRNLAIAGAAVAGYGLLNHNNTATLLGAAGAALAGSQYEQVRQQQSQDSGYGDYNRRYHRTDNNGYGNNGYGNNGYGNNGYGNNGYTHGGSYRVGEGGRDNGSYNNGGQWRHDNNSSNRDDNSNRD